MASKVEGDLVVTGGFAANSMTLAAGSVVNATVGAGAGIAVDKLQHLKVAGTDFGIAADAACSGTVKKVLFVASGACTIRLFKAVERDTGSSSSVTYDLQKAGVGVATLASILSAVITIANSDTDNTPKSGTLSSTTLVAGDMLVAVMTTGTATGTLGPFAWVEVDTAAN